MESVKVEVGMNVRIVTEGEDTNHFFPIDTRGVVVRLDGDSAEVSAGEEVSACRWDTFSPITVTSQIVDFDDIVVLP